MSVPHRDAHVHGTRSLTWGAGLAPVHELCDPYSSCRCHGFWDNPESYCTWLPSQLASPDTADGSFLSIKACSNCIILTNLGVRQCRPFLEVDEKCMLTIIDLTENAGVTESPPSLWQKWHVQLRPSQQGGCERPSSLMLRPLLTPCPTRVLCRSGSASCL